MKRPWESASESGEGFETHVPRIAVDFLAKTGHLDSPGAGFFLPVQPGGAVDLTLF